MLKVGDEVPEFEGVDSNGRTVRLRDLRGKRLVLFFFPKAFTMGCTVEVRRFRDNHERIRALGAELVGVSVDKLETQCAFAKKEQLDFPLLGDSERRLSKLFGVLWPVVRLDRRVTFVIGPQGRVEEVIQHEALVHRHLDDVLAALEREHGAVADTDD